eukprot:GGOE01045538.1.p1 GENE.GGOE01045538.1~~GGOE01045538.1.p1  ORF type:complete len:1202 (-),score=292.00 GGOE01045538.1:72-3410(-)
MYEVTLGSGGIQQLGWTTVNTQWTTEEGVGDHSNSYAYDGSRIKKWNVQKYNYGKAWEKGDIVGCCIDLDEGTMTFHQNGECLGVAFRDLTTIRSEKKLSLDLMAYFPAASLSHNESCWLNFGQHPFVYPIEGYNPIQMPDPEVMSAAPKRKYLCLCIHKLTLLVVNKCLEPPDMNDTICLYNDLFSNLLELSCVEMDGKLTVQQCDELVDVLLELHQANPDAVGTLIHYMLLSVDQESLTALFSFLTHRLCYKSSIVSPSHAWCPAVPAAPPTIPCDPPSPHTRRRNGPPPRGNEYLRCLSHFLTEEVISHWLRTNASVYLDILNLLSVKPPNVEEAKEMFPFVWWSGCLADDGCPFSELQAEQFFDDLKGMAELVRMEDGMRISLLQRMAEHSPEAFVKMLDFCIATMRNSCRMYSTLGRGLHGDTLMRLFFGTLEVFNRLTPPANSPGPVCSEAQDGALNQPLLCVWPFQLLRSEDEESRDLQRFGGILSYLRKEHPLMAARAQRTQPTDVMQQDNVEGDDGSGDSAECLGVNLNPVVPREVAHYHEVFKRLTQLYSFGVKEKARLASTVVVSKGRLAEKLNAILKENRSRAHDIREELHNHIRRCAWEYIVYFSNMREEELLSLACRAIHIFRYYETSVLFRYLPNFLLEVVVNILQMLRKTSKQYLPLVSSRPEIVLFLLSHIQDERIVNPDVKELILSSVNALMETDARRREVVVMILRRPEHHSHLSPFFRSILTCFNDSHNWVTVIDIFLKFYSGLGFGFPDEDEDELDLDLFIEEQPDTSTLEHHLHCSQFFTQEFLHFCEEFHTEANDFVKSVLNHLNWSMSELAISLAEQRPSGSFMAGETNAARKCSIMFDMSCKLLHILESATDVLRYMFLPDPNISTSFPPRWSAVPSIEDRLKLNVSLVAEVVAHALNRFTCGEGSKELDRVLSLGLAQLQGMKKARLLSPVAGILINLVLDGPGNTSTTDNPFVAAMATNTDRKWNLDSISFLKRLDWLQELAPSSKLPCNKLGLLHSPLFLEALETAHATNNALREKQQQEIEAGADDNDDDDTCPICCSAQNNRQLKPCDHRSCNACISRHLLNSRRCFFCNCDIESVEALESL